jgi:hypothetical protein
MLLLAEHSTDHAGSSVCEHMYVFWTCHMLKSISHVTAYQPLRQREGQGMCCFLLSQSSFPLVANITNLNLPIFLEWVFSSSMLMLCNFWVSVRTNYFSTSLPVYYVMFKVTVIGEICNSVFISVSCLVSCCLPHEKHHRLCYFSFLSPSHGPCIDTIGSFKTNIFHLKKCQFLWNLCNL